MFHNTRDDGPPEADDATNLLWRYEVSEDGGKTWFPEEERADEECYVLRRGNWVAPSLN
ncbi:MAG: hypothetical protein ABL889_17565 [Terricaulis sp.]